MGQNDLIGVGYNLGGGVSLETAYVTIEETDNYYRH